MAAAGYLLTKMAAARTFPQTAFVPRQMQQSPRQSQTTSVFEPDTVLGVITQEDEITDVKGLICWTRMMLEAVEKVMSTSASDDQMLLLDSVTNCFDCHPVYIRYNPFPCT